MSWGCGGRGSWLREEEGWGTPPDCGHWSAGWGRVVPVSFPLPALFYPDGRRRGTAWAGGAVGALLMAIIPSGGTRSWGQVGRRVEVPGCGQAWAAGAERSRRLAPQGTPGTNWTRVSVPPAQAREASVASASVLGGRGPAFRSSLCPADVLPGHGLLASLAWARRALLALAVQRPARCPLGPDREGAVRDPPRLHVCLKIHRRSLRPEAQEALLRSQCLPQRLVLRTYWVVGSGLGMVQGSLLCRALAVGRVWWLLTVLGPGPQGQTVWGPPLSHLAPGPEG